MTSISLRKGNTRLPPEVNRVLYVRNLPFNISSEEMYDIFGKYGAIRQIRIGTNKDTRGTAFVVYEDIYDAKTAVDHLSGFNVANRYLIVLYYQQAKMSKKFDQKKKEEEIAKMQEKYGVSTKDNAEKVCMGRPKVEEQHLSKQIVRSYQQHCWLSKIGTGKGDSGCIGITAEAGGLLFVEANSIGTFAILCLTTALALLVFAASIVQRYLALPIHQLLLTPFNQL
ncbi:hypothetical protein Tsubulata_036736 [Turnera subulata]|uniref:RRM domain-containing protein n=1 Tax=Turnera subulata TaxID=218843 RepID=A0A9Q0IZ49_9ROSI|nr:hypothetical protein Tsubulata_036736 [Turnera subulata]